MTQAPDAPEQILDVAIVGGGCAGLYSGWSLLTRPSAATADGAPPRVALFERSERLGGRLYTERPEGAPHLNCELGGMRYKDTQELVADLIDELGLESRLFPLGDEHNLHYLRGHRFSLAELHDGSSEIPYAVDESERNKSPSDLMATVLKEFLSDGPAMTHADKAERERTMRFDGRPIEDVPAIDVVRRILSDGAGAFFTEGMGYTCILDEHIGAANLIHTDLRGGTLRTLVDGMQALPLALGERYRDAGGSVMHGYDLAQLAKTDTDGLYRLHFDGPDGPATVTARHVVLAMPAHALKALDLSAVATPQYERDLDSVVAVPAAKLYFGFTEPWWEMIGLHEGRSVTDLPIRQCLYFGVEGEQAGADPHNTNSLLVASYSDGDATRYWEARIDEPPYYPTMAGLPPALAVSAAVVEDVRGQLSDVHGTEIPAPKWAAFMDWTLDPFGGGWHYWRTGHRSVEVVPRMRRPFGDERVYVCGESFSSHQGWILGALSSAERVLQEQFGASHPGWLRRDADLGA